MFGAAFISAGPSRPRTRTIAAAFVLVAVGALVAAWQTHRANTVILDSPVTTTISGVVTEREADANGRWRYAIRVTRRKIRN
jgi:hypothetical protein